MEEVRALLKKYKDGLASNEEKARLVELLGKNETAKAISEEIWQESDEETDDLDEDSREKLLDNIMGRVHSQTDLVIRGARRKYQGSHRIRRVLSVAASLAVFVLSGFWIWKGSNDSSKGKIAFTVAAGETPQSLDLADGSTVWLNASSSIEYSKAFEKQRHIELSGEAYFSVAKDANSPFTVSFGDGHTLEVTGTEFNVFAHPNEDKFKVQVTEGSVNVYSAHDTSSLVLGDELVINRSLSKHDDVKGRKVAFTQSWRNGSLVFDNEPIDQVLRQLERKYDVSIEVQKKEGSNDFSLTAEYRSDIALEKLLEGLDFLHDIDYEYITNDSLHVRY